MTTDTQKTADAVARIMELDAKRSDTAINLMILDTLKAKNFEKAVANIRELLDVIQVMGEALDSTIKSGSFAHLDKRIANKITGAVALAAPLMKLKGDL
jgi:hypothetical protein